MTNRTKIGALAIAISVTLVSCNQNNTEEQTVQVNSNEGSVKVETTNKGLSKGFQLLKSSCFSCHSPNINIENKVAPSWAEIKTHYAPEGVSKERFTNSFIEFVSDPKEEKAIIPQAVEHYGVMPKFNLSEEQLSKIANYIYSTELEIPDWYEKHFEDEKQKHKINIEDLPYKEQGLNYVMSTKSVLGKNLKGAIKSKGTENAVAFCNERAYPLVDSMAVVLNTKIKRVSDKPRNPLNTANELELKYIAASKQILVNGGKIKPQVQEMNGKMIGYYPIITNKMCMQCHGEPNTQILPETIKRLNSLYPKDMATGYTENQLRGIWVVEMNKK